MSDELLNCGGTGITRRSIAYDLSAYDAAYLELAERKQAGLATLDAKLLQATRDCGVEVFATC